MFSLGMKPYPEIENGEELLSKLTEGYRLSRPPLCPLELFDMMKECWVSESSKRPNFEKMESALGKYLDASSKEYLQSLEKRFQVEDQSISVGSDGYVLPSPE